MAGGVLSVTVTSWVAMVVFPLGSLAVYVIVVVPVGNRFPAGTPERVTATEQLSLAAGVPRVASLSVSPHWVAPGPVPRLRAAGAVIVGFSVSEIVTVCVAELEFPCVSVAVQEIVVVPFGKGSVSAAPSLRVP